MSKITLLKAVLNLFEGDGGAASSGDGSGTAGAPGAIPSAAGKGKGEFANVVYGKPSDAQPNGDESTEAKAGDADQQKAPQKRPFKELVNGEYKEEFDELFKKRLKDYKDLQAKVTSQSAVMDMLMAKYGIQDGNLDSLTKAIEEDDAMWADAADDAGMSIDQYKQFNKLQRENAQLMREAQERVEAQQAQERESQLLADAEAVKQVFPDFDLGKEIANTVDPVTGRSKFVELLSAGIDMETAYKTIHFNELMTGAIQQTQRETEKNVTGNIRAKGMRPQENGTTSQSAFTYKTDPAKWTKKDRAEVVRRVARGEKIIL